MADRQERTGRRRPFSTWVKKLAGFKNGSSSAAGRNGHPKNDATPKPGKKRVVKNNNPYPQSGRIAEPAVSQSHPSLSTARTGMTCMTSNHSLGPSRDSGRSSTDGAPPPTAGAMSMAPTISTMDHDATHSIHAPSHMASSVAGTSRTVGGFDSRKGGDSTFSSPAPSVRSLTTTLTTIQSMAPNGAANGNAVNGQTSGVPGNAQTIQFSQPFPTNSPASAIPPHLAPPAAGPGHPTTYSMATANNLSTDNASILTLASSSKRRRRRSMDTDASVRAMAPSSLWGGSRESLPLSVLSANVDGTRDISSTPGLHQSTSRLAGNERTSIYSTAGVAPALPGDRNSLYAGKQSMGGDGASVRSGLMGHGRADSISGSVGGMSSPLVSPREVNEKVAVQEKDEITARKENDRD
ncbi:Uu.00g064370.m01.CDS01 [Anthostomella pinea]|uniref:Uu.00g064370.m01.CDS01 n=1 Tax=Anthostomella pinea TaxID=933095 RepID=A0AAI8VTI8_9PEZI|nr:Uu.00g064370.m01.CDS01 [Anthostomella pinea]